MRTTISIEDSLLEQAREWSRARSCTLGEVIEEALRESLSARRKAGASSPERPLRTHGQGGLQPGVELTSGASLLEAMEGQ